MEIANMKKTNDIYSQLEKELGGTTDKIEPGYRTTKEWGKIWGMCHTTTKETISKHLKSGRMTQKIFRVQTINNSNHNTPHYKAVT